MNDLPTRRPSSPRGLDELDGNDPDTWMHALRTPLTVAMLRAQIFRRHLRRGDDLPSLEAELDHLDATLRLLATAIDRLPRD